MKYTDDENVISILAFCVALHANANLTPENAKALLDLINRQKAEIERLNTVLSNEAIVPPVKIGQTVYSVLIYDPEDELDKSFIEEYTVDGVAYIEGEWYVFDERDHELYKVGTECCQLTRADAEKVLAERGKK